MLPEWVGLLVLAALICAVIFIGNVHLSTTRLVLLFAVSLVAAATMPAVSSILGPVPGVSAAGETVVGSDGRLMYTAESMQYWSWVRATGNAMMVLAGMVFLVSALLLLVRLIGWYRGKRDAIV